MNTDIISIRKQIPFDVFDYRTLVSTLSGYRKPRDKITSLLESGLILRIRKGLYCFSGDLRREPLSREYVANLVYGPSYVSLKYALSVHGIIPERVHTVTSVTIRRSRDFETPVGVFSYRMVTRNRYDSGADLAQAGSVSYLIATPEKALIDEVWTDSRLHDHTVAGLMTYLIDDLRIEPDQLAMLDVSKLRYIAERYDSRKIDIFVKAILAIRSRPDA